ncbi:protein kinase-like domain, concanavalin A-like lectin/glucanase domain protein [Tanacetum coccineum]
MRLIRGPVEAPKQYAAANKRMSLDRCQTCFHYKSQMCSDIEKVEQFSWIEDKEEEDEEDVENVYDGSANLIQNTKAGGSSSFTAAAGKTGGFSLRDWHGFGSDYNQFKTLSPTDKNANPSCSTSNREFLDPKKKKEIESWLGDSRIVESLDGSNEIKYFDTFPTMEELEYHEWFLKYPKPSWQHYNEIMNKGLESRQKPSNPSKNSNFIGRVKGLKVFVGNFTYECNFMILEDTTSSIDHHLGEVVFGKPFARNNGLVHDQEEGTVTFEKDDKKITFKMPYKMEASNRIYFKDINTDSIPPFVLGSNDDHGKTYNSDSLTLGPDYREDESISKEIRHLMKLEREAKRHKREVTSGRVIFDEKKLESS